MNAGRSDVPVGGEPLLVLGPDARHPVTAEGERGEGRLEQDALALPLVDGIALHHALPAADLLVEAGADPAGRMDAEVAPELAAARAHSGAHEELRRAERAAGDDHGPPGANGERLRRALSGPGDAADALDADRAVSLEEDAARLDSGPHAGPRRDRPRQVGDVHRPLRVEAAAVGAGGALDAAARVSAQGVVGDAERLCALHQELAVATHGLGVDRRHAQELLGLRVLAVELRRPADAVLLAPALEHGIGGAKAGSRVDHRRAADGPPDGGRDRGDPLGHREPAVAVERGERLERLLRVGGAVHVRPGLEHEHLESRLGEDACGDRAPGARADDHDVAVLAAPRGARSPSGCGPLTSGSRAAGSTSTRHRAVAPTTPRTRGSSA